MTEVSNFLSNNKQMKNSYNLLQKNMAVWGDDVLKSFFDSIEVELFTIQKMMGVASNISLFNERNEEASIPDQILVLQQKINRILSSLAPGKIGEKELFIQKPLESRYTFISHSLGNIAYKLSMLLSNLQMNEQESNK